MSGGRWLAVFASVGLFALAVGWAQWSARDAARVDANVQPDRTEAAAASQSAATDASTDVQTDAQTDVPTDAQTPVVVDSVPPQPEPASEPDAVATPAAVERQRSAPSEPEVVAAPAEPKPTSESMMRFSASKSGMLSGPGGGIGLGSLGAGLGANANEAPK